MIPTWVLIIVPILVIGIVAACWWGSNVIFHPPLFLSDLLRPEELDIPYESMEFKTEDDILLREWTIHA